jgi:hypothetical protein
MENTISFIVRYERNSCLPYITYFFSWQYDVKLLNKGKKIIVNLIKKSSVDCSRNGQKSSVDCSRNRQTSNKDEVTEKILYDDDIELSKSQIDLLKIFYKPNCNGIFQIFVDCNHNFKPDDVLKYFCEIIDKMKKSKDVVFTREEINMLNNNHVEEINMLNNNHVEEIYKLKNNYKEKVYKFKINHEEEIYKLKKYNYDYNKIILNYKLLLNKLKIEIDKKNKILIDKLNQIKNNILEKIIEDNKLKLEDITELYNLLLLHEGCESRI